MHMTIGIITFGENKPIARDVAKGILADMLGEGNQPFDYGNETGKTVSVKGDIGRRIISRCMRATTAEFLQSIKNVRRHLEQFTDKQLATSELIVGTGEDELDSTGMAKFWMYKAGQYKGNTIYLYDNDGEGIRTREHLTNALRQWSKPVKGQKVYVTPFDVNY